MEAAKAFKQKNLISSQRRDPYTVYPSRVLPPDSLLAPPLLTTVCPFNPLVV